ncbi:MAG: hypothetical protein HYV67_02440 [Candidatus Taylorbacteria bacterium]|nr:hypothetical protein [Candidatus Taylorbacteria bacterium]
MPSRKIILAASVAVVVIAITLLLTRPPKVSYTAATAGSATTTGVLAKDSDQDGLKDWEEELWKTDPQNPDTDGDGAPDGQEIKLGRNPLLKGPNDRLDSETVSNKINSQTDADLSDTDKFSRELFVKIIAANQSPTPPTEADFQNFLNATIKNEIDSQKLKIHTAADFSIDMAETAEKIKTYGNAIAAMLKKPPPQKLEYEISTVERAEKNKDPSELKALEGNITAYKHIENDLLKLTVPQSALEMHLALANATAGMAWSITGLSYIMTDPLKALPGVAGYAENAQNFSDAVRAFRGYFENANVTFNPEDDGYRFFDEL